MRKFFSPKGQIRLIKKALKSDTYYTSEELIKLKTSLRKLEKEVEEVDSKKKGKKTKKKKNK